MLRLLVVLLFSQSAFSLTTAYVSFDQPEGWRCELASGVWVCQSALEVDRKESVVLSIATIATEWDTLENFEDYLKKPRSIQDEDGNTVMSQVRYTRRRNINGFNWIDSLQLNSELPGFWARYLVTVHKTPKHRVAILITYVVSEDRYSTLAPQFERMVLSLKPNAEFDLNIASKQGAGDVPGSQILGPGQDTKALLAERLNVKRKKPVADEPSASSPVSPVLIGVGLAAIIGLVIVRRRRKSQGGPKEPNALK
jgi:hypothetical protein